MSEEKEDPTTLDDLIPKELTIPKKAEELVEELKKITKIGTPPDVEKINQIRHLWGIEGLEKTEIAKLAKVSLSIVHRSVDGIPRGKNPYRNVDPGQIVHQSIGSSSRTQSAVLEAPKPISEAPPPRMVPQAIRPSKETVSALYMASLQRGFPTIDEFIMNELLPWYGIKLEWEWRCKHRMTAEQFMGVLDIMAEKSVKYDSLLQEALARDAELRERPIRG